ncbi:carbohydrate binding domain-containing protein [bacterium]|nr:carbohydrate binding domain-containing protein [bacterium]
MRWMEMSVWGMLVVAMCAAQPLKEWTLANPGFEQGLQGWALVKPANAASDTAVGHTGAASLKLSAEDQSHPFVAQSVKDLQGGAKYALRVWARGVKGGQTKAVLKIEYYNAQGANTKGQYSDAVTLDSEEWRQLSLEATADPDTVRASLLLRLMSPGEAWFDDVSFVMTEAPAPVTTNPVRIAVAAGQATTAKLDVRLRDAWDQQQPQAALTGGAGGALPAASAQAEARPDGVLVVTATIPALPAGDYALKLTFGSGAGAVKVFAYDVRRSANMTEDGTLLVGGKPFFPIGAYHVGVNEYPLLTENGFNAVQGGNPTALEDFRKLLDEGLRTGIMMDVPFYTGGKVAANLPNTLAKVAAFKTHPAVLNWKIIDEPDLRPDVMDEVANAYREIRALDGAHPVLLTIASPPSFPFWVNFCDMLQVDPYPLPRNPLTQVSDTVKAAKAVLRPWQHLTAVLQCGWVMDRDKPANQPTYEQALSMVYLALINGAKGISWYSVHDPGWDLTKTPLWARMKELNAETALAGKLVTTGRPLPPVTVDNKDVQAAAWQAEVQTRVLVTNPTAQPQTVTLKLAQDVTQCRRLQGVGEVEVADHTLKVSLPAYGSATLAAQ